MKSALIGGFCLGIAVLGIMAQQPPQPMAVEKVAEGIYLVSGGAGANCGFVVGDQEVLAIDAKMTVDASSKMLEEMRKISPNPVRFLLLTHSDQDHVNGIQAFPPEVVVVSQEQTRLHMDKAFTDPVQRKFLPALTFAKETTIYLGAQTVRLLHFGPAHTNGDMIVFFPDRKAAFVGDLLFIGRDPLIHPQKGGSSSGLIQTWKEILKLDAEIFLPGHGRPAGRRDAEEFVTGLEAKRNKVVALVKSGKTLAQVKAALGEEEKPVPEGMRRWPTFSEIVYQELTAKK